MADGTSGATLPSSLERSTSQSPCEAAAASEQGHVGARVRAAVSPAGTVEFAAQVCTITSIFSLTRLSVCCSHAEPDAGLSEVRYACSCAWGLSCTPCILAACMKLTFRCALLTSFALHVAVGRFPEQDSCAAVITEASAGMR